MNNYTLSPASQPRRAIIPVFNKMKKPASLIFAFWLLPFAFCLERAFPRAWLFNAHNCYPAQGRGADRLTRARRAGLSVIEIDLAWSEARKKTVIRHDTRVEGNEPTLDEYFFAPMLPELRRLPRGKPGILLWLDFKSAHPGPVREIYDLLHRYRDLITTAGRRGDGPATSLDFGPLAVALTGDNSAIAQFEQLTKPGEPYLAIANREPPDRKFQENVADYITEPATAFYRIFNFEWKHIEGVPNNKAGDFTASKRARLNALAAAAHSKGYWLRTWNLNATNLDWGEAHCFGTKGALFTRWRAAQQAGIEMIATDEYELAGQVIP
jgi:hypothetical protein